MEFSNDDIRLKINGLSFKAYLEESEVTYEPKDQSLPFVPTSFRNDSMANRVTEKVKFSFNVFSEDRQECIQNYRYLRNILETIKPQYSYVNDQLTPYASNVTGFINVSFKGMPVYDAMNIHLTSFSYYINKDLGYIQIPNEELPSNSTATPSFSSKNMKLVPIAYKLSIEGKVLLEFDKTARVYGSRTAGTGSVDIAEIINASGGGQVYNQTVYALTEKILKKDPLSLSVEGTKQAILLTKQLKDAYLLDISTGGFAKDNYAPSGSNPANTPLDARKQIYEKFVTDIQNLK